MKQFLLHDVEEIETKAALWVRNTSKQALAEVIGAGNPPHYAQEIDGSTTAGGKVKRGRGFIAGSIEAATRSVRFQFVGSDLVSVANELKPQLLEIIAQTFPRSISKQLEKRWVWYVQLDGAAGGGKQNTSRRLGERVPDQISMYDVLWLAPDAKDPATYAWFANRMSLQKHGKRMSRIERRYWALAARSEGRTLRKFKPLKRRMRGFMATATRKMRGTRSQEQRGPLLIQAKFITQGVTAAASRSARGVPVIRVAFKRSLNRAVST